LAFINSPLTGLYNLFGKTPGKQDTSLNLQKGKEANVVDKKYTKELVKKYYQTAR